MRFINLLMFALLVLLMGYLIWSAVKMFRQAERLDIVPEFIERYSDTDRYYPPAVDCEPNCEGKG